MNKSGDKQDDIEKAVDALRKLPPIQVEVMSAMIAKFAEDQSGELTESWFLDKDAFDYFSTRLAVHHASSGVALKKENFEHILEQSFRRAGREAHLADSKVHRGADIIVDGVAFSLKTEGSKSLDGKDLSKVNITISKLMEARWIRDMNTEADAPDQVRQRVLSHLEEYEHIFILRSSRNNDRVHYELREIPKDVMKACADLVAADFGELTNAGGTSAKVQYDGKIAFTLRLDGSVEKVTISGLNVALCPLHAHWELGLPG